MRSDAVRRRAHIVREARRLFAGHGGGIALERIAEASGVGIATLYRNFPSRSALAEEVAVVTLSEMRAAAEEALERTRSAPEQAWRDYATWLVEMQLGGLIEALADFLGQALPERVAQAQAEALVGVQRLLTAQQQAGVVRDDVTAVEVVLAIALITRPQPGAIRRAAPQLTPHLLSIFLDGMRPPQRPRPV